MQAQIFYTVVFGFISGVLLRSFFIFNWFEILWVSVLGVGVGVVYVAHNATDRPVAILLLSLYLCMNAVGIARFDFVTEKLEQPLYESALETDVRITGVVSREPDVRTQSQHLYIHTETATILVIADRYVPISYGDSVLVTGLLTRPESFTTDLGRTFNYPGYVAAQGARYMIRYPDQITVLAHDQGTHVVATLLWLKTQLQSELRHVIPEPHSGLAEGLLLGEKQALGSAWNEVFRRAGIIHIVVLSGYNVMLVVAFCLFIFSRFFGLRGRAIAGISAIICFALIVGLSATVVRASIMAGLVLAAAALGRSYAIMRGLLLAGVVMVAINPYLLVFDPGFQLSFLATLGLIIVAPYLEQKLVLAPRSFSIREFLVATLATQIAVLPFLLYQIGELSIVSVVVNILVLPIVPLAMLGTFVTGLLGFVSSTLATIVGYLTFLTLHYILVVASFFASLPGAAITVPAFSFWWVLIAYGAMGYFWWRSRLVSNETMIAIKLTATGVDTLQDWELVEVER